MKTSENQSTNTEISATKEAFKPAYDNAEPLLPETRWTAYQQAFDAEKQLRKKENRKTYFFLIDSIALGALAGFLYSMSADTDLSLFQFLLPFYGYLLLFFVFYQLHIVLHEAGHLVCGLLTGYRFLSFRIFSFTLIKKDGRLQRKKLKVAGTAGQCLLIPPKRNEDGSFPFTLYNLGGGLSNLLFSAIALLLFVPASGFAAGCLLTFAIAGIFTGIQNLIPRSMPIWNDGKNLLQAKKSAISCDAFYKQLDLNAKMSNGCSALSFTAAELMPMEGAEPTDLLAVSLIYFRYQQALALEETEAATEILSSLTAHRQQMPTMFVNMIELEEFYQLLLADAPVEQLAPLFYYTKAALFDNATDLSLLRIRYAYERLLSPEDKALLIMLTSKPPKKLKNIRLKKAPKLNMKLNGDEILEKIHTLAEQHPVVGETVLNLQLLPRIDELAEERRPCTAAVETQGEA